MAVWAMGRSFLIFPHKVTDPLLRVPKRFGPFTVAFANVLPSPASKKEQLQRELLASGQLHQTALVNFLATRNFSVMMVWLVGATSLASGVVVDFEWYALAAVAVLTIMMFSIPRIKLSIECERRKRSIKHAFPDILDMVSMTIEGGLSVEQSLSRVASEFSSTHPSLSQELDIVSRQTKSRSLSHSMSSFGKRVDIPEVAACAIAIAQSKQLGVGVAETLREAADRMRETRKQEAEQAGNLASIKLLLPVVLCLAPPVFILLVGPAFLDLRDFVNRERASAANAVQQANLPASQAPEISTE